MNKIYYDIAKGLEVVDVSGAKTIEQLNADFIADFVDVTEERNAKIANEKLLADQKQDAEAQKQADRNAFIDNLMKG